MAVTTHASGSQTCVAATEHTLTLNPETTAGAFQLLLDLNGLAVSQDLEIRVKEKVQNSAGTQRVVWYSYLKNAPGVEVAWVSPVLMLLNGWDVSLKSNATPVIIWSIRKA